MSPLRGSRRAVLASGVALLGGCLGSQSPSGQPASDETDTSPPAEEADGGSGSQQSLSDERNGYPPATDTTPTERPVDTAAFERIEVEGATVPLVPVDIAHYWHQRRAARFADARGERSYEQSHLLGAVLSPAPEGRANDPAAAWPKNDRIVCYCGCPHHLSSLRAATLLQNGYENVYVIDEGFWEWHDRGYPLAGSETTAEPAAYHIEGRTAARYAGETAWVWHEPSGQREAAPIANDGRYSLEVRFADVSPSSVLRLRTPDYERRAPLSELADGTVR
jgi:rhodanese-related sulfurtransferase